MKITLSAPSLVSSFQFLVAKKPTTAVVSDIFASDLNGDGIQEFIISGRQENTIQANWTNATVHIFQATAFGWVDKTSKWLQDNEVVGSEPNIVFGDFNNDGKKDFFIAGDTDTVYLPPSYLFLNTGDGFSKQTFNFQSWAHGAFAADVNQDGYFDVLATDYGPKTGIGFGSANGITYKSTDYRGLWKGSGICAADFLGDGSITILVCDTEGTQSTGLYKWNIDALGQLSFIKVSTLPLPRFELPKYDQNNFGATGQGYAEGADRSHDIRIVPFDFSGDGLVDAIELSRPWFTNGVWPEYSEVQFLLNKGGGKFEDVTDTRLKGYNKSSTVSYQPVFMDANSDGRIDIFLSAQDFQGQWNSTVILLQEADGTFVEYGRDLFSTLWQQATIKVKELNPGYPTSSWVYTDWGNSMQLVQGMNGKISVIGAVSFQDAQGGMSQMVFSSDLSFSDIELNEKIKATSADDIYDGGIGLDSVLYSKNLNNYSVKKSISGQITVNDKLILEGNDILRNIERLQFLDKSIAFDLNGNAGTTAKILGAVFGKESLSNKNYVGIGLSFLDSSWSYDNLAGLALDAAGAKTNDQIVSLLWTNVIGTKPTAADKQPYIALLENGMSAGALAHLAADSSYNTTNINLVGLAQTGIEYIPVG